MLLDLMKDSSMLVLLSTYVYHLLSGYSILGNEELLILNFWIQ